MDIFFSTFIQIVDQIFYMEQILNNILQKEETKIIMIIIIIYISWLILTVRMEGFSPEEVLAFEQVRWLLASVCVCDPSIFE